MKRLMALLLALLMLSALVAGCSPSGGDATATPSPTKKGEEQKQEDPVEPDDEKITLSYWTHLEEPWNISDEKMIAAFQDIYPNVTIKCESFPYDEFESKTQTSLISKSGGADIYKLWGGWAIDYAPTGAFAAAPDSFYSELQGDCYDPVLGAFEYEGKLYGVPLEFNAEYGGMLVLKPYFDENNLSYPTTWDDMIRLATEQSASSGDVFEMRGLDFISWDTAPYTLLSMILSSGGQYVTNGNQFDFNTPIAKEALQKLSDYITVNKMTSITGLSGGGDVENFDWLFLGKALMAPRGIWTIPVGENDYGVAFGEAFDYVPMPFYGSEKKWAAETGWGLAVNANTANSDAAWNFVEFMMQPDNLLQINIDCGMIPPRKSVAHEAAFVEAMPYAKPIVDILDGAQFVGAINTDILKEAITEALVDMVLNGTSVDDAVLSINERLA